MRSLWVLMLLACSDPAPPAPEAPAPASEAAADPDPAEPEPTGPDPDAPDFLERLDDEAQWTQLAAPSSEHAVARTEVVKVLFDQVTDRLYFCQSARWPLHYDFAVRFIQTEDRPLGERRAFMTRQYLRPDRDMQMASLVRYRDADLWTLELGPADNVDGPGLVALFERVRGAVYFGDALRYRPRSELHRRRSRRVREQVRAIEPNAVWDGVEYQPVTLGEAVGRLRFVEGAVEPATVLPDQILVLDHVPDDVPLCAGIVTAQIQAPLAHVAVLSQSRGTPNMALRGVMEAEGLRALEGRIVRLTVRARDYAVGSASADELAASIAAARPPPVDTPAIDASRLDVTDTCDVRLPDATWAGAKAAQLGEVCGAGVPTSAGFVIPLGHYRAHLTTHDIASAATLRETEHFATDGYVRERALAALRERVVEADIDEALVARIHRRVRGTRGRRWIFRSSTNAEDLPGFSGAGLYESVVTRPDPSPGTIADAIREVWASVWTRRAWDEREYYRVDHDAVAMAILVQPFVENVVAMGVAITENPFSRTRSGILVNLAPPGGSVTAATGEELPEQVLLYRHSRPEILSRSTRNEGRPILAPEAMRPLRDRLDRVHDHMMARWGDRADAADVELALRRDGTAVILQARPYRMRR